MNNKIKTKPWDKGFEQGFENVFGKRDIFNKPIVDTEHKIEIKKGVCVCCGELSDGFYGEFPIKEDCYISGKLRKWLDENKIP